MWFPWIGKINHRLLRPSVTGMYLSSTWLCHDISCRVQYEWMKFLCQYNPCNVRHSSALTYWHTRQYKHDKCQYFFRCSAWPLSRSNLLTMHFCYSCLCLTFLIVFWHLLRSALVEEVSENSCRRKKNNPFWVSCEFRTKLLSFKSLVIWSSDSACSWT